MVRLRHSEPLGPGLRRVRHGRGFRFLDAEGAPASKADVARAKALVIPPAWTDVWICPWPNGHIQATGLDAAGRRQYLYHEDWRRRQDRLKHDRVLEFAARLPALRGQVAQAMDDGKGLSRERVLGAAVRTTGSSTATATGRPSTARSVGWGLTATTAPRPPREQPSRLFWTCSRPEPRAPTEPRPGETGASRLIR
jgi:DNA topoisomerase IB